MGGFIPTCYTQTNVEVAKLENAMNALMKSRLETLERVRLFIEEQHKKFGKPNLTQEELAEIEDRVNTEIHNMNRMRQAYPNLRTQGEK